MQFRGLPNATTIESLKILKRGTLFQELQDTLREKFLLKFFW